MPSELVDNLASPGAPQPDLPAEATAAEISGGDSPPKKSHKGLEGRAKQLWEERNWWREKAEETNRDVTSLRDEVSELRGRLGGPKEADQSAPRSWSDLSASQVQEAFAHGFESQNPNTMSQSVEEMIQRKAEAIAEKMAAQTEQRVEEKNYRDQMNARIKREFEAATDEQSPLYQTAAGIAQQYVGRYGQDVFEKNPDLGYAVYALADRQLRAKEPQEIERLRQENLRLKQQQNLEPGNVAGAEMNDASKKALERNDIKEAIRNLNVVKNITR